MRISHKDVCKLRNLVGIALATAALCASPTQAEESPFSVRAIKLGGPLESDAVERHVAFSRELGFNTLWLPCRAFGPLDCLGLDPAELTPAQRERLRGWVEDGWRVALVSIPGPASSAPQGDRAARKRIAAWRAAGIQAWVVSTPDPETLTPYRKARWARRQGKGFFWYRSGRPDNPALPETFGRILTAGPQHQADELLAQARAETSRPLWLEELYPGLRDPFGNATAVNLGPLRERPTLPENVTGYVATPMAPYLGASRLSLYTVADYLRDPAEYDPDRSWDAARRRLAGPDAEALGALNTQSVEWGGWFGSLNFRAYSENRPDSALATLRNPAAFASYGWTVKRYAERMQQLSGLKDDAFREELLLVMKRRLALARALPIVRAILDPRFRPELERGSLYEELARQRADLVGYPDALAILDRFLELGNIPLPAKEAVPPSTTDQAAPPAAAEPESTPFPR